MKIAFFNKFLPSDQPNGVSVQVHRLANALVKKGHSVTIFSFSPAPSDALYKNVQLSWGRCSKLKWIAKFIPAFGFRAVDTRDFDIIHYHGDDYLSKGAGNRVRTFYGSAFYEAIHAHDPGRFFYQALFYLFELISCMKKGTKVAISKNSFRTLPHVTISIPCGVPLDRYQPGLKSVFPSILFAGDLFGRKRGALLLKIFQNQIRPVLPQAVLKIIGPQDCDGSGVIYLGRVTENCLIHEFKEAWVYCMPSSYEGFGVPVIEAMASGTAVVASDNAGVNEIITNGKNGIISSDAELGKNLLRVLQDEILRKNLINEGCLSL